MQRLFAEYTEAYPADPSAVPDAGVGARAGGAGGADRRLPGASAAARRSTRRPSALVPRPRRGRIGASLARRVRAACGRRCCRSCDNRARLKRADLVGAARGAARRRGADATRSARYYHQMEQGLLPASGVSDSVLEALGRIVGYGADALRKAGEMPAAGGGRRRRAAAVFARQLGSAGGGAESRRPPAEPERMGRGRPPLPRTAIERQLGRAAPDLNPMNELLRLYRYALRVGDRPLAELLSGASPAATDSCAARADQTLQAHAARAGPLVGGSRASRAPGARPARRRDALSAYDRGRCNRPSSSTPSAC